MAYAADLKSAVRKDLGVRIPSPVPGLVPQTGSFGLLTRLPFRHFGLVELRGLEPLTSTLPASRSAN